MMQISPSAAAHSIADRFLSAMAAHITANHDVAFYADYLQVSPDYLTRCVKKTTGKNPKAIIQRELARRGGKLLSEGAPVAQTAATLGFDSAAYFSRFFHRVTGHTPSNEKRSAGR
jgi:AraC-like DNA-binding protein